MNPQRYTFIKNELRNLHEMHDLLDTLHIEPRDFHSYLNVSYSINSMILNRENLLTEADKQASLHHPTPIRPMIL